VVAAAGRGPGVVVVAAVVVAVVAVLTVHNLAGNLLAPARYYVPGNLAVAAVVLGLARAAGAGGEELGMSPAALPGGLAVGLAGAGVVLAALALAAAGARTRPLLADGRMAGVGARGTAYRALVRIPLGTVALEEVAFRGALPALAGPVVACALFGLWHVVPTVAALDANGMARSSLLVAGAVLFTAAAGGVLYGLAAATGSLLAPALVHLAANSGATVAAYRVLRRPD